MCAVQLIKKGFMFAFKGLSVAKYFDDEHAKRQDQEPKPKSDEEEKYFDFYTYIVSELYDSNIDESID